MAEKYYKAQARNAGSPFLMHWRYATNGKVSVKNSHPFRLAQGGALIHNGVLSISGMPDETSDSRFLTNNIINRFPNGWEEQPWWTNLLQKYIGWNNKLAMIFDDKSYLIVNESQGHWKQGIWYSNSSYVARPAPVTYSKPQTVEDVQLHYWGVEGVEDPRIASWRSEYLEFRQRKDAEEAAQCALPLNDDEDEDIPAGQRVLTYLADEAIDYCPDCFDDIFPGVDHECDIPAFVMEQLSANRSESVESKTRVSRAIVPYGRVM